MNAALTTILNAPRAVAGFVRKAAKSELPNLTKGALLRVGEFNRAIGSKLALA